MRSISRRAFLKRFALAGTASVVALSGSGTAATEPPSIGTVFPQPQPLQQATGTVREFRRIAEMGEVEIGPGMVYRTWLYNGRFPGEEIRVREGERLRVTLENRLPEGTTIHWHGVPVPNAMDGVPEITQASVAPGQTFVYEFVAGPPGSYVYHSHQGLQVDRGLFGSLVIEESTPHIQWDREYTVILDDFLPSEPRLSGVGTRGPMGGMRRGMGGMGRSGGMGMMGIETPPYTGFLVNGRLPSGAPVFEVSRGDRARLRLINPSGTTTFRVTIAGHQMMVSHTDGRPIRPVFVDSLIIGTGERYDVIVNANNPGVWALIATPLEVNAEPARAVIRYKEVRASNTEAQLPDRRGRDLRLDDLISVESAGSGKTVDRTMDFVLSGGMMSSAWTMNGQAYPAADPLSVRQGERVRVRLTNHSMMIHPMHLHGHFFRVGQAVKDTVIVPPFMGRVDFDFLADNPGNWFFHCHNVYHMESGMARVVRYVV